MKLVCISDTHSLHRKLAIPDGDVLIHAGDWGGSGSWREWLDFNNWLDSLPHKHKVIIPGNHDEYCEEFFISALQSVGKNVHLLNESGVTLDGVTFWGSPWTPEFFNWSFMYARAEGKKIWERIPDKVDVLITHGPPAGILDTVMRFKTDEYQPESTGCIDLLHRVRAVSPKVHIFGHIHEGYGQKTEGGTLFVNASSCTEHYRPINPPQVIEVS